MAGQNLLFWHTAFGFAGSWNEISILDATLIHKCFVDGTHSQIDLAMLLAMIMCFQSYIAWWMVFTTYFSFYQYNLCPDLDKRGEMFSSNKSQLNPS